MLYLNWPEAKVLAGRFAREGFKLYWSGTGSNVVVKKADRRLEVGAEVNDRNFQ